MPANSKPMPWRPLQTLEEAEAFLSQGKGFRPAPLNREPERREDNPGDVAVKVEADRQGQLTPASRESLRRLNLSRNLPFRPDNLRLDSHRPEMEQLQELADADPEAKAWLENLISKPGRAHLLTGSSA